ncbi:Rad52/Rad22 family DNA repair protein [Spirosoma sp. KNUC1025]|uniref:Rad52/Rad22 family DNA repair protein n=1 Tax=Spirosoma sp. KNUC1025 TaxID=2894082 RepID=UPI0038699920|nr:DNA repair protein Rad52 [Spirosoma sp. KNUC1025]
MDLDKLTSPIRPDEVEWRVQNQTKDGQKLIVVPYVTNRSVMERFDAQFGWDNWENSFQEVGEGFLCTITVTLADGRKVSKSDAANRTNVEPVKGGVSDAMKRCAVQFGLGRDLYRYPKVMIQTSDKYIPDWAMRLLDNLVFKINQGKSVPDLIVLKPEHAKSLAAVN